MPNIIAVKFSKTPVKGSKGIVWRTFLEENSVTCPFFFFNVLFRHLFVIHVDSGNGKLTLPQLITAHATHTRFIHPCMYVGLTHEV